MGEDRFGPSGQNPCLHQSEATGARGPDRIGAAEELGQEAGRSGIRDLAVADPQIAQLLS